MKAVVFEAEGRERGAFNTREAVGKRDSNVSETPKLSQSE